MTPAIDEQVTIDRIRILANQDPQIQSLPVRLIRKSLDDVSFFGDFVNMESQKIFTWNSSSEAVPYVDHLTDYTLTMTIAHDFSEEYCVINATSELECLMILFLVLKRLGYISSHITLSQDNQIVVTAENNWRKGMPRQELLESAQRHMNALWR